MKSKRLGVLVAALLLSVSAAQLSGGAWYMQDEIKQNQNIMLTEQLGLTLAAPIVVMEQTESATSASYRVLARMSQTQLIEQIAQALPDWTQTSFQRGFGGTSVSYTDGDAQTLRLQVRPIGRSNLFNLKLRLYTEE